MRRRLTLTHEFVEFIPEKLEEGKIYVSIPYATASHRCCCGCGREVVTPLTPTDWSLTFNGETVSLHPSIGNWSFDCRSHYWIRGNGVVWAKVWSPEEVAAGRQHDTRRKEQHYERPLPPQPPASPPQTPRQRPSRGWIRWLLDRIR